MKIRNSVFIAAAAALFIAHATYAGSQGSIEVSGEFVSENFCDIGFQASGSDGSSPGKIELGKHNFDALKLDDKTSLGLRTHYVSIKCGRDTPLALKFSTPGTQPTTGGIGHSMSLGEIGPAKANMAYADVRVAGDLNFVFTGKQSNIFDVEGLEINSGGLVNGFETSTAPEARAITFVNADGALLNQRNYGLRLTFYSYAKPKREWQDLIDQASIPIHGALTLVAVYL